MKKKSFSKAIRFIIGLLLIYFIYTKLDQERLIGGIESIDWLYVFFAFLTVILNRVLMAYKWDILLRSKNIYSGYFYILKVMFIGNFLGMFLPTSVGGDITRIYYLTKGNVAKEESVSSVLIDRLTGFFSLFTMALLGLFLSYSILQDKMLLFAIISLFAIFMVTMTILFNIRLAEWLGHKFKNISFIGKVLAQIKSFYVSIVDYRNNLPVLYKTIFISFVVNFIRVIQTYLLFVAVGANIQFIHVLMFVPISLVITQLPISIAEIGIKEGIYVYLFSTVGIDMALSFLASVIGTILQFVAIIPGFLFYVFEDSTLKLNVSPVNEID